MSVLARLTQRERVLVLGLLPVAIGFAAYQFAWVPLAQSRMALTAEIISYRTVQAAAQTARSAPVQRVDRARPSDPLPTRIARSAEAAGVALRRLEPEGALVRVTLDDAAFETVIGWIAEMERDHAIILRALELDRRTAPGVVSARMTLETAP